METDNDWRIIVATNGWVYAGRPRRDGDRLVIEDCFNVRRWSMQTRDGLGGLAERAPGSTENDLVDRWRPTRVHILAVVADQDCNQDAWNAWFAKQNQTSSTKKAKTK